MSGGAGVALASVSVIGWFAAIGVSGEPRVGIPWILGWNTAVEFGIYLAVALSVAGLSA